MKTNLGSFELTGNKLILVDPYFNATQHDSNYVSRCERLVDNCVPGKWLAEASFGYYEPVGTWERQVAQILIQKENLTPKMFKTIPGVSIASGYVGIFDLLQYSEEPEYFTKDEIPEWEGIEKRIPSPGDNPDDLLLLPIGVISMAPNYYRWGYDMEHFILGYQEDKKVVSISMILSDKPQNSCCLAGL